MRRSLGLSFASSIIVIDTVKEGSVVIDDGASHTNNRSSGLAHLAAVDENADKVYLSGTSACDGEPVPFADCSHTS